MTRSRAAWWAAAAATAFAAAAFGSWLLEPAARVPPPAGSDADGDPLPPWAVCRVGSARFRCADATVAFTADGARIVHGTTDGCIRIIDRRTGEVVREFAVHRGESGRTPTRSLLHEVQRSFGRRPWRDQLVAAAVSPDGTRIATRGYRTTNVWEIATGRRIATWKDDESAWGVAWTPDGARVVTCDHQTGIVARDAASGRDAFAAPNPKPLPRGYGGHPAVAVSPSGSLAAAQTYELRVVDLASGAEVFATEPGDFAGPVAFSPDGAYLLHTRKNEAVVVRETKTWKVAREFAGNAFALALSVDGSAVAVAGERLRVLDFATGAVRAEFAVRAEHVAFSPDGSAIAAVVGPVVRVFDLAHAAEDPAPPPPLSVACGIAWSPDGRRLALAHEGVLRIADAGTGLVERSRETGGVQLFLRPFTADGRRVGVYKTGPAPDEHWLAVLDIESEAAPSRVPLGKETWPVYDAASGEFRVLVRAGDDLRVADTSGTRVFRELPGFALPRAHEYDLESGLVVERAGTEREFEVRDMATRARLAEIVAPAAIVDVGRPGLAGGRLILCDDERGCIALFDARTGERRLLIEAGTALEGWIEISRDGSLVAAFDREHAVRVFDGMTGRELARFSGHRGGPRALVFSPDARRLATASEDGTILVWDVEAAAGR